MRWRDRVQGTRYRSSVPLGTAVDAGQTKSEARGNQPQATDGLPDWIPFGGQARCSTQERVVFLWVVSASVEVPSYMRDFTMPAYTTRKLLVDTPFRLCVVCCVEGDLSGGSDTPTRRRSRELFVKYGDLGGALDFPPTGGPAHRPCA